MAHELWENDNMISVREIPWHGLGIVLPDYPDIFEAQRLSGLTWSVRKEQIYYRMPAIDGMSRIMKVPSNFAIVRNDNQYPLGVVGEQYEPFQNDQMFAFMDQFMSKAGSKIETCGSLRNGRVVWAMAQAGSVEYLKNDPIAKYFLFKNGFDASQNVEICFTDIRVVCNNTLQAALRDAKNSYKVRHTASVHVQVDEIGRALASQIAYREKLAEVMDLLLATKMTSDQITTNVGKIVMADTIDLENLEEGQTIQDLATRYQSKTIGKILELHESGAGAEIPGFRGTAYGVLNACTEWADHERIIRPGDRSLAEARFESIMDGSAAKFKQRAFNQLVEYAVAA